jgi:transposase
MSERAAKPPPEPTPYERFVEATKRVLSVSKKDVDKAMREWRRRRRNKKRPTR